MHGNAIRVRSDKGGKNIAIARMMLSVRGTGHGVILLASVPYIISELSAYGETRLDVFVMFFPCFTTWILCCILSR